MYVDVHNLLNLSNVAGIGSMKLRSLIAKFKSAEDVFKASIKELISVEGVDLKTAQNIKEFSNFKFGERQYKRAYASGSQIITFWDEKYPSNLKNIYDPPVLLFIKGDITTMDKYAISIVGTRMPSYYGKVITEKISKELGSKGLTIVSGLARGVDTIAHLATIKASGRTFAVIGTGIDVIYPSENKKLVEQIINNGALISEFPMGTPPDAVNFPKRNRIIAGLTLGTVITEAGQKSGALITANLALDYNREVFAVPGNITSSKSQGTNQLIKDGAKLIVSADDILEELRPHIKKIFIQPRSIEAIPNISVKEKELLSNLSETPIHIDELARKMNKSTAEILSGLLSLEFRDFIKQLPGKLFIKTY